MLSHSSIQIHPTVGPRLMKNPAPVVMWGPAAEIEAETAEEG